MRFQCISTKVKRICVFPYKQEMIIPTFPYVDPQGEEYFVKLIPKIIPTFAYVDPQKEEIFVKLIPKFANVFVVYRLNSALHFHTAADLVLKLLPKGILGLPMRVGFIHNNQSVQLESWKRFRNRTCCFHRQSRIEIKLC